jgi:hypothetical protein
MVMFSAFDLETYLPIARQAMGRGVSSSADNARVTEEMRNMMCVSGLVDGASVEHLYHAAYLVAADERDMPEIIQIASMPHITADSATRGIQVTIISGSLLSWSQAILRGCAASASVQARNIWNLIHKDLQKRSLCDILEGAKRRPQQDSTYLLEYRP